MIGKIVEIIIYALMPSLLLIAAYVFIRLAICSIKKESYEKVFESKKERIAVYLLCFLLSVVYVTMKEYWGTDTIYSFFSKNEFETRYYVHLFPEGSKSKNYLVPADLYVYDDNIIIKKVYWPNGGYTTFDRFGDMNQQDFYLEGHTSIEDDEGREWTIVLTKNKVKK